MSDQPRLMLCFLTSDEAEIRLALDYWNWDTTGDGWQSTVLEVATRANMDHQWMAQSVRQIAEAYDLSFHCVECGRPKFLKSRVAIRRDTAVYSCGKCLDAEAERLLQDERDLERQRADEIDAAIRFEIDRDEPFDYSRIDYFNAMLVYSLMFASDPACETGKLGFPSRLSWCSTDVLSGQLLSRLHRLGILLFDRGTPSDALETADLKDGYFPLRVKWRFARDAQGASFGSVFRQVGSLIDLRKWHNGYQFAVRDLWWMLAFDDASNWLNQQLAVRGLHYQQGEKRDESLRQALTSFSIPQVRNLTWRVAKDAADLSVRRDFHRKHALNTIPGSLIRIRDRALGVCLE